LLVLLLNKCIVFLIYFYIIIDVYKISNVEMKPFQTYTRNTINTHKLSSKLKLNKYGKIYKIKFII